MTAIRLIVAAATWNGVLGLVLMLWGGPALVANTLLAFLFDWLPHHPHSEHGRLRVDLVARINLGGSVKASGSRMILAAYERT